MIKIKLFMSVPWKSLCFDSGRKNQEVFSWRLMSLFAFPHLGGVGDLSWCLFWHKVHRKHTWKLTSRSVNYKTACGVCGDRTECVYLAETSDSLFQAILCKTVGWEQVGLQVFPAGCSLCSPSSNWPVGTSARTCMVPLSINALPDSVPRLHKAF